MEFLKSGVLLKHEVTPQLQHDAREYRNRERANLMNTLQRANAGVLLELTLTLIRHACNRQLFMLLLTYLAMHVQR